jgi:hypothetical protein
MDAGKTIQDALSLVSKVSTNVSGRLEKVEKAVSAFTKKERTDREKQEQRLVKIVDKFSGLEKMLNANFKKDDKKPEQVVEEKQKQEVVITSFGRDATQTLDKLIESKKESKLETKPSDGLLSKLKGIIPLATLVIGGLAGLISTLMTGKFGEFWNLVKAGKLGDAFEKAKEIIYKAVSPILKSLPIIGPILSIKDGIEEFNKGNAVGGLKNLVQGVIGLLPLPMSVKASIIGAVELLGTWIEGKVGEETIPKGSGGEAMAIAIKTIGKYLGKVLKRIPIIGSLISFYDAYEAFKAGGAVGITKGLFNIASGVANLVPGAGTAIAIGLDIISALLFTEKEEVIDGKTVTKIDTRDWFKKFKDILVEIPIISNLISFGEGLGEVISGDVKGGLKKMALAIPGVGFIVSLFDSVTTAVTNQPKEASFADLLNNIVEAIMKSIIETLPNAFGIRYYVAKALGIKTNAKPPETSKQDTNNNVEGEVSDQVNQNVEQKKEEGISMQAGTRMMLTPAKDFIKTDTGKIILPDQKDTLVGAKLGGPFDKIFTSNLEVNKQGNNILKKYAEDSSDLLSKQLNLLTENNRLLNSLTLSLKTPTNNVSKSTNITNTFANSNTLRSIQGLPLT